VTLSTVVSNALQDSPLLFPLYFVYLQLQQGTLNSVPVFHGVGDALLGSLSAIPLLVSHIIPTVYIRNSARGGPHAHVEKNSHASRAFHVGEVEVERVCHAMAALSSLQCEGSLRPLILILPCIAVLDRIFVD
jgi:hypothetical protein